MHAAGRSKRSSVKGESRSRFAGCRTTQKSVRNERPRPQDRSGQRAASSGGTGRLPALPLGPTAPPLRRLGTGRRAAPRPSRCRPGRPAERQSGSPGNGARTTACDNAWDRAPRAPLPRAPSRSGGKKARPAPP